MCLFSIAAHATQAILIMIIQLSKNSVSNPISSKHTFIPKSIPVGRDYDKKSSVAGAKLIEGVSKKFQPMQLAVRGLNGGHIATGVTIEKLTALRLVEAKTGGTAKDIRRTERILSGLGINSTNFSDEMKIRIARIGVMSGNAARHIVNANPAIFSDDAKLVLARVWEKIAEESAQAYPVIRAMMGNIEVALNRGVDMHAITNILKIADSNPFLAIHLAKMAADDHRPIETIQWVCQTAMSDPVLDDLHGPNFLLRDSLPTKAHLGFTPALHLEFSAKEYEAAKDILIEGYGENPPGFVFDDKICTIHTAHHYQSLKELGEHGSSVCNDAVEISDSKKAPWAAVEWRFGNPKWVQKRQQGRLELLANCHQIWHQFGYERFEARVNSAELEKAIDPTSGLNTLITLLRDFDYPGLILGEFHNKPQCKKLLCDAMQNGYLTDLGVTEINIEHINSSLQSLLDEYANSPDDAPMPVELHGFLASSDRKYNLHTIENGNLLDLVTLAKKQGIKIVGLDNNVLSRMPNVGPVTLRDLAIRDMTVNLQGKSVIEKNQKKSGAGKYIVLTGWAHNQTHVGLNVGVPGFSQILELPEIRISDDMKIIMGHENLNNRAPANPHLAG
jgi:hypothetical protein